MSPNSLHSTIGDLHHPSATTIVFVLLPMGLFATFSYLLCTDVVSVVPTLLPEALSDNFHAPFVSVPLCPLVSIAPHTICFPRLLSLSSSTYIWFLSPSSPVSIHHLSIYESPKPPKPIYQGILSLPLNFSFLCISRWQNSKFLTP